MPKLQLRGLQSDRCAASPPTTDKPPQFDTNNEGHDDRSTRKIQLCTSQTMAAAPNFDGNLSGPCRHYPVIRVIWRQRKKEDKRQSTKTDLIVSTLLCFISFFQCISFKHIMYFADMIVCFESIRVYVMCYIYLPHSCYRVNATPKRNVRKPSIVTYRTQWCYPLLAQCLIHHWP